jgi:hypothetical protein
MTINPIAPPSEPQKVLKASSVGRAPRGLIAKPVYGLALRRIGMLNTVRRS